MSVKIRYDGAWVDTGGGSGGSGFATTGMIIMFTGTTAPSGWVFCDGNNGTPDLRNRFVVASNDMGKTGISTQSGPLLNRTTGDLGYFGGATYEPGDVGGENGHQLLEDELAAHDHSFNGAFDAQTFNVGDNGGGKSAGDRKNNQSTGDAGGNKYHENRPPYYALAFIMKT